MSRLRPTYSPHFLYDVILLSQSTSFRCLGLYRLVTTLMGERNCMMNRSVRNTPGHFIFTVCNDFAGATCA